MCERMPVAAGGRRGPCFLFKLRRVLLSVVKKINGFNLFFKLPRKWSLLSQNGPKIEKMHLRITQDPFYVKIELG
jgi:hypothetical protein